jgi:hypothetical protein
MSERPYAELECELERTRAELRRIKARLEACKVEIARLLALL